MEMDWDRLERMLKQAEPLPPQPPMPALPCGLFGRYVAWCGRHEQGLRSMLRATSRLNGSGCLDNANMPSPTKMAKGVAAYAAWRQIRRLW